MKLPHNGTEIDQLLCRELTGGGVYAVGGRVRDEILSLLGRPSEWPPDLDYLVTGIELDDIISRLGRLGRAELVGASFGVVKFTRDGLTVDVALPRREWSTGSHHRDFKVDVGPHIPIEEDLARRDFRVNMMARDLRSGALLDPYDGRRDLEARRLDVLGPKTFVEDPLRIARGAQIAARFDLTPTSATLDGMRAAAHLIDSVAPERLADELTKLLERSAKPSVGLELLREVGALERIVPELTEGWNIEQNEYHAYTVYYHSLYTCDAAPRSLVLRLAALLHDVGKPKTKDGPHFYNHQKVGKEMARKALRRLRFPSEVIERVESLVEHHMFTVVDEVSDAGVRRFIRRVGIDRVEDMFALRYADIAATGLPPRDLAQNERFAQRVREQIAGPHALSLKALVIGGDDVIALMRDAGLVGADFRGDKRVGAALAACLERVLEDPKANERDTLLQVARETLGLGTAAR